MHSCRLHSTKWKSREKKEACTGPVCAQPGIVLWRSSIDASLNSSEFSEQVVARNLRGYVFYKGACIIRHVIARMALSRRMKFRLGKKEIFEGTLSPSSRTLDTFCLSHSSLLVPAFRLAAFSSYNEAWHHRSPPRSTFDRVPRQKCCRLFFRDLDLKEQGSLRAAVSHHFNCRCLCKLVPRTSLARFNWVKKSHPNAPSKDTSAVGAKSKIRI